MREISGQLGRIFLGQVFGGGNIPALPGAPLVESWLFESPWAPVAILLVAAAVVVFSGRLERKRARLVAGACVFAAGAFVAVSSLVTTSREAVLARTEALVDAGMKGDAPGVGGILTGSAALRVLEGPEEWGRDEILERVGRDVRRQYGITKYKWMSRQAVKDGPNSARTQVQVRVFSDQFGAPASWWRMHWRHDEDGVWRCTRIELLQADGLSPGMGIR